MRDYYEIEKADVGKAFVVMFGRAWSVADFIGCILPGDVGKRVYRRGDILQVENDQQYFDRVKAARIKATFAGGRIVRVESMEGDEYLVALKKIADIVNEVLGRQT